MQEGEHVWNVSGIVVRITEPTQALQSVLVNIFDLIDAYRTGDPVHVFNDWKALWAYTKAGKFYDLERAMSNELLKALLRDESEPPQGKQKKKYDTMQARRTIA